MEVLRRLAKEPENPDCVVLAEKAINDYLKNEIDALKGALARVGEAIDEEAEKRQGEDWSVMIGYVQSCLEKLPAARLTNLPGRRPHVAPHNSPPLV
jgi:hypothetical protein